MVDGHAALVVGGCASYAAVIHSTLPKGWLRKFIHTEPVVFAACALGVVALVLPNTIIPMRRALGMPTNQYDGVEHPNCVRPKLQGLAR